MLSDYFSMHFHKLFYDGVLFASTPGIRVYCLYYVDCDHRWTDWIRTHHLRLLDHRMDGDQC